MAHHFLKAAVVYLVLGIGLGMYMGIGDTFGSSTAALIVVHTHVNLLGWVTFALFGLIYWQVPTLEHSPLSRWHFWLMMVGAPCYMLGLFLDALGWLNVAIPFYIIGPLLVSIAVVLFAIMIFRTLPDTQNAPGHDEA